MSSRSVENAPAEAGDRGLYRIFGGKLGICVPLAGERWCEGDFRQNAQRALIGRSAPLLDHVPLQQRPPGRDALISEIGEVERDIAPVRDQFGKAPSDRGRLLHAVAGEARRKIGVV